MKWIAIDRMDNGRSAMALERRARRRFTPMLEGDGQPSGDDAPDGGEPAPDGEDATDGADATTDGADGEAPRRETLRGFDDLKQFIEGCAYDKDIGIAPDMRLGSVIDEQRITDWLKDIFKDTNVEVIPQGEKGREWADVTFRIGGRDYHTNIKSTKGGADNISSKKGVVYYLSNGATTSLNEFIDSFRNGAIDFSKPGKDNEDYFMLVLFKKPGADGRRRILFTSVGRLREGSLTPNFNNQPFQVNWNRQLKAEANGTPPNGTAQQKRYVALAWHASIVKGFQSLDDLGATLKDISDSIADSAD